MWRIWHTAGIGVSVLGIGIAGLFIDPPERVWVWLLTMLFLTLLVLISGHGITGRWRGFLIDDRNKMSLSRLQITLWTVIVLSGYWTAVAVNLQLRAAELAYKQLDPFAIAIPEALWILMGISTVSLLGSPLIKNAKKKHDPNELERKSTVGSLAAETGDAKIEDKIGHNGQILVNKDPAAASVGDMFKGEETGNGAHLDLAKVQMFFFTAILVLSYAVVLGSALVNEDGPMTDMPALGESMVALLGISHAGYLTHKAIPLSKPK